MSENNGTTPGVSIIVPMYNAERFIEETLTSVLNQTFKDYELLVIDDCSTDRSVEIVEGMRERFDKEGGGVLRLIRLSKNSGYSCVPRNVGLRAAAGKYISFLDNDDLYTPTALEELWNIAEKYQVEVLRADNRYGYRPHADPARLPILRADYAVDKLTFETDNVAERLQRFINGKFAGNPQWKYFIRRDFIVENELEFPKLYIMDDNFFTVYIFVCAKQILLIPNAFYIYRWRGDSLSHKRLELEEEVNRYLIDVKATFEEVGAFMDRQEFFIQHPEWRMRILNYVLKRRRVSFSSFSKIVPINLYRRCDQFNEMFLNLLPQMSLKNISKMMSYYFTLTSALQYGEPILKRTVERLTVQTNLHPVKPPKGAVITYFGTFLSVDNEGRALFHSGEVSNAVIMIPNEKKFSLHIPKFGKYIASVGDHGEIELADDEKLIGEIVKNNDETISLMLDKKMYLRAERDGRQSLINKIGPLQSYTFNG